MQLKKNCYGAYEHPACTGPCGEDYDNWCPSCMAYEAMVWQDTQNQLAAKRIASGSSKEK
jgi:hypothetical protein